MGLESCTGVAGKIVKHLEKPEVKRNLTWLAAQIGKDMNYNTLYFYFCSAKKFPEPILSKINTILNTDFKQ